MKKIVLAAVIAIAGISLLSACTKTESEPVSAPVVTEQPQATKSPQELIVGKWTITEVTGLENSSVNTTITQILKEGASITITDDKKIKFGVLSADYSTEGNDTLTVSSSLLPSSIEIKYNVDETSMTATFMHQIIAKCTREN